MAKAKEAPDGTDGRIHVYRSAVRSMRQGIFDVELPAAQPDPVGELGRELIHLAEFLDRQFNEARKLQEISEEIMGGLFVEDVLNRIFETFRSVIPYNRLGCALLSDDGHYLSCIWGRSESSAMLLQPGYTAEMAGSSLQQLIDSGQPRIINSLEAYLRDRPGSGATRLVYDEGVRSSLTCPLIAQGKPIGFLFFSSFSADTYHGVHQGIFLRIAAQVSMLIEKSRLYQEVVAVNEKLLRLQQDLEDRATHDVLTGIYNRRALQELLQSQWSRAQRQGQPLALLMLDIDFFKNINDSHGHAGGDMVLQGIAVALKENLRDYNYLGRYGGEEFLVLLAEADYDGALAIAERLRAIIAAKVFVVTQHRFSVTVSIGVGLAQNAATTMAPEQIVTVADEALYDAKRKGRNRVECRRI